MIFLELNIKYNKQNIFLNIAYLITNKKTDFKLINIRILGYYIVIIMKIIELLTKEQNSNINELINKYGKNNEFEVSLFSNKETSSYLLTLEKFNNLNSVLNIVSSKNEDKYKPIQEKNLDIIMSIRDNKFETKKITNYRISIIGLDKINKFMEMLHIRKNHLVFSVLIRFLLDKNYEDKNSITIMKKTKNVSEYVTLEDIYMRFKLDIEEPVSEAELQKLTNINKNWETDKYDITYRYKERTSYFIKKEKNVFRVDLTTVKTSNQINRIESSLLNYEIEVECDIQDKSTILKQIFDVAEFIIKSVQGSNYIITKSTSNSVLNKYRELLSIDSSKSNLYLRQPISLEVQHLVDYLPNRYAVTDKADGDRNLLIVYQKRCYLVSTNLIVRDSGLDVDEKYNNTMIDGELIYLPKFNRYLYMAFDCLIFGNDDLRKEIKFMKRLETMDSLIYDMNKCKFKHINILDSKIDVNNISKILEFHKKCLEEFYDDIDAELKLKSIQIIFRRKYFIPVNGVQDNEIFKYTSFLWKNMNFNKNMKYPYLNDGLIFQPLDQRYEIESDKSKYSDYKWKPPNKNSIDFYVEFEKDRSTGKILNIYDNSVDGLIKNKPYQIANLFVGQNIKGVEKPILFGLDESISQAYIYIDTGDLVQDEEEEKKTIGFVRSEDGKIIHDKTVVEFYYNLDADSMNQYKWIPMKTRFDKTEAVQRFGRRYGNAMRTAEAVWRCITNPIYMSDFDTMSDNKIFEINFNKMKERIDFDVLKLEKQQNIYFQKKDKMIINMKKFHNYIKSVLMYTYLMYEYKDDIQLKVLDFGIGRGADLEKYYYNEVELVVGIDPRLDGLTNSSDSCITRYKNIKKGKDRFPPMYFVHADATAILQYDEQTKALGKMSQDNKKLFDRFFTWNNDKTLFDAINCQFVFHYLLSSSDCWNNLTDNMNMYLREGGYFIFTTFDGNLVREKLKDKQNYTEYYDDNGEKKILFDIVKKYDDKTKEPLGQAIDVYMSWLFDEGVYLTEYLVYPEFIIKSLAEKCNMKLVETGLFEEMFNDGKEFLSIASEAEESQKRIKTFKDYYKFYEDTELNKKLQAYSFLNRYYVFRKTEFNLEEVKKKFYGPDRKRIAKGKSEITKIKKKYGSEKFTSTNKPYNQNKPYKQNKSKI